MLDERAGELGSNAELDACTEVIGAASPLESTRAGWADRDAVESGGIGRDGGITKTGATAPARCSSSWRCFRGRTAEGIVRCRGGCQQKYARETGARVVLNESATHSMLLPVRPWSACPSAAQRPQQTSTARPAASWTLPPMPMPRSGAGRCSHGSGMRRLPERRVRSSW